MSLQVKGMAQSATTLPAPSSVSSWQLVLPNSEGVDTLYDPLSQLSDPIFFDAIEAVRSDAARFDAQYPHTMRSNTTPERPTKLHVLVLWTKFYLGFPLQVQTSTMTEAHQLLQLQLWVARSVKVQVAMQDWWKANKVHFAKKLARKRRGKRKAEKRHSLWMQKQLETLCRTECNVQTESSLIVKLPGEVRNMIYEYVFQGYENDNKKLRIDTALTETCRLIYRETSRLPRQLNELTLPLVTAARRLDSLARKQQQDLDMIRFCLCDCGEYPHSTRLSDKLIHQFNNLRQKAPCTPRSVTIEWKKCICRTVGWGWPVHLSFSDLRNPTLQVLASIELPSSVDQLKLVIHLHDDGRGAVNMFNAQVKDPLRASQALAGALMRAEIRKKDTDVKLVAKDQSIETFNLGCPAHEQKDNPVAIQCIVITFEA